MPEHVLDAWLWQCIQLRDAMETLRDPVALPTWPPALVEPSPVSSIQMLRLPTVLRRVGIARSHVYRRIEAEDFPRPVPLGQRVRRWASHEVDEWRRARLELLTGLRRKDRDWYMRPPSEDDDDRDDSGPVPPA